MMRPTLGFKLIVAAALSLAAVLAVTMPAPSQRRLGAAERAVTAVEEAYADLRAVADGIELARSRGSEHSLAGEPSGRMGERYATARVRLGALLASAPPQPLAIEDDRALQVMRRAFEHDLPVEAPTAPAGGSGVEPDCHYDAAAVAQGPEGLRALKERIYSCYGRVQEAVVFEGETLDRLTILSLLGRTPDPERRRRLFLSLDPVWRSINGDDSPSSPYRQLVRFSAREWSSSGSPVDASIRALGVDPALMEGWLVSILERWRAVSPWSSVEPWDYWYLVGEAGRALGSRALLERFREINDRFYASLGADPSSLGIRYDLEPRSGKTPVAFTTFGRRGRMSSGRWQRGEFWVFATYRSGGLDNLSELLHETGHGVHIAAIRARPAFDDWPDSDPFTEALADLVALEIYEPQWQQLYLGRSVALVDALRAKYAGVMLDIAWALFEIRLHKDPQADPNALWAELTRDYLGIAPHPELSWWAMRGQLVDAPGYMMNYAVGAIVVADLRARARGLRGPFTRDDRACYPWLSERLYRFGLARPSREVISAFLGRPLLPQALLDDMSRIEAPPLP